MKILGKALLAMAAAMAALVACAGTAQAYEKPTPVVYRAPQVSVSQGAISVTLIPTVSCNFFSVIIDGNAKTEYHGKAKTVRFKVSAGLHDVLVLGYCGYENTKTLFDKTVNVPYTTYKVKKGQTLWRIAVIQYGHKYAYAEKGGHEWRKIAKANGIKGTKIRTGQILVIP